MTFVDDRAVGHAGATHAGYKVGIVGFGYIGSVIGACLAEKGCDVLGIEVDPHTVSLTNEGKTEHFEPKLSDLVARNAANGRLKATGDFSHLRDIDYIVVTVGTPLNEAFQADLRYINAAADSIGRHLRPGHTVVLKSTVIPTITRDVFGAKLAAVSGLVPGKDFYLAFSPERIAEGKAVSEFLSLPIVVGADDDPSAAKICAFWHNTLGVQTIKVSSTVGAELTKLADNLWIDMNIAVANQVAKLCQTYRADFGEVQKAANTLPKGQHHVNILQSSIGVGGSCLTKDPLFFAHLLDQTGQDGRLIREARAINDGMPAYTAETIARWLKANGKASGKVAVMGVAFKNDTNDLRYTPVLPLLGELQARSLTFQISDPHVTQQSAQRVFGAAAKLVPWEEAVADADALCFACGHTIYREIDLGQLRAKTAPACLFVDGRHSFSRQAVTAAGFEYIVI
jgi:UDP-N-acetyl-D-mannosaminuronic acid dehydrogenase